MTVRDLIEQTGVTAIALPEDDREVEGVYIGDLLSWVMGRAQSGNVWITIMSNLNVVAVASLSDVSCVLLAENVQLDDEVKRVAEEKGINVLSTPKSAYEIAAALSKLSI